jgi:hypothetical protein
MGVEMICPSGVESDGQCFIEGEASAVTDGAGVDDSEVVTFGWGVLLGLLAMRLGAMDVGSISAIGGGSEGERGRKRSATSLSVDSAPMYPSTLCDSSEFC